MTRVNWDVSGQRLFHTGVDRGMLYVGVAAGVPWNGLASVTETRTGGDAQPVYLDGRKVQNTAGEEDFGATIETFTFPIEFSGCAGRVQLAQGLYAADQPKQPFAFSYRTLIGNDLVGPRFAYRIHVVYNAIGNIADFTHETVAASPAVKTYSGQISTVPFPVTGYRPTSHVIVDTRHVSSDGVEAIENMLYGGFTNGPMLPTVDELITLMAS